MTTKSPDSPEVAAGAGTTQTQTEPRSRALDLVQEIDDIFDQLLDLYEAQAKRKKLGLAAASPSSVIDLDLSDKRKGHNGLRTSWLSQTPDDPVDLDAPVDATLTMSRVRFAFLHVLYHRCVTKDAANKSIAPTPKTTLASRRVARKTPKSTSSSTSSSRGTNRRVRDNATQPKSKAASSDKDKNQKKKRKASRSLDKSKKSKRARTAPPVGKPKVKPTKAPVVVVKRSAKPACPKASPLDAM
ncbi:hypothetical protein ml_426 [Mollivirus sibericum]|uniref:hypothetical protein n=1 Tax=Mollivirus sibericum TaxID=1678078 RepID=UPI0006B2DE2E|nr:hypothetical protein ml_426 [Mollivirus sibericum]ALD62228.1 hypothetical protein ml_426 [Mollivirus sibericum]